jgi:hypothetical protein
MKYNPVNLTYMNKNNAIILALLLFLCCISAFAKDPQKEFYEIRIYHFKNDDQVKRVDDFLKNAYLPALHRAGINNVGVFKPIETDTADRKMFVLIPFTSLDQFSKLTDRLAEDKQFATSGKDYIDAPHNNPPYARMETIILKAFKGMPQLKKPALTGPRGERVYELRSYEGHTEKIFQNKVKMFNDGDEVGLFDRLGFNAVFYAEVIAGSRVPNLMYMTTFENKASRDEHWKSFGSDPQWKTLSSMPEYQNNVSKIDIFFIRPTEYSDY